MAHSKTVLITGCSSGIGLCAAIKLQQRGYRVIATLRSEQGSAELRRHGIDDIVMMDLASSESVQKGFAEVIALCDGQLFGLFNNAAYGQPGAVEDLSRAALREQFDTNVFGTHELTTLALPYMLKMPDARIVQNSSILGFAAMPMRGAYNASKFALEGLTDTLRLELRGGPVKVSLIEPGPIVSNFRKNALAALTRHVDVDNSRHGEMYSAALARLNKEGPASRFTLAPEAVVQRLIHALESRSPKARYYVTFPTYLFGYLRRFLSISVMDWILLKASKSE